MSLSKRWVWVAMEFCKNIRWLPSAYRNAAVVAREVGEEMLSRLTWITLKPKVILDIGCGTAELSTKLKAYYNDSSIFAIDLSTMMLDAAKQMAANQACVFICADAAQLPFGDQSVDLIFANLLLPWHASVKNLLREWRRVLNPNGLLIFTALGMDTMKEWKGLLDKNELPYLVDMHDLGDWLIEATFADPVLDVDYFTLSYRDKKHLFDELCASGMWSPSSEVNLDTVLTALAESEYTLEVTYEVIYGHAFIPVARKTNQLQQDGTVHVSLDTLKQQLKK
jgi:malonyl-CoA O-methyltransferase